MDKTIKPGFRPSIAFGIIVIALVILWVVVWVKNGARSDAWQPITFILGAYFLFNLYIRSQIIRITDSGIARGNFLRQETHVAWSEIEKTIAVYLAEPTPLFLHIFGTASERPLLTLRMHTYHRVDVEFILGLEKLKIEQ